MSGIQGLGQQISKLISDSNNAATSLYNLANGLQKTEETILRLMQSTSQRNYQDIVIQLSVAKNKLANAADNLAMASRSGSRWLEQHVNGIAVQVPTSESSSFTVNASPPDTASAQSPLTELGDYMSAHNYGESDYSIYSQDPKWRVLHRAAFPNDILPPIAQATAFALLSRFMAENNYGIGDFSVYSQDPIWQELHKYAFPERFVRPDSASSSQCYSSIVESLERAGVGYQTLHSYGRERTSEEIIGRLGGGDNTDGSCSSLAFAYAGNMAGYDVLDFRDGESRKYFSKNSSIEMIAKLPGVDSHILSGKDDISCTNRLLNTMVPGKEYYLATGVHAAIVRTVDGHFEYLELQHPTNNGWHYLDDKELLKRFHCSQNNLFECPNFLIDIASLTGNQEFLGILGYLNTAESEQRKGVNGHVR